VKRSSFVLIKHALVVLACVPLLLVLGVAGVYVYISPSLPTVEAMRKVELQVPLRVYTRTGGLISQIGEQRRIPVTYDEIPELVRNAVLAPLLLFHQELFLFFQLKYYPTYTYHINFLKHLLTLFHI
jgi:penicillin-binding protein 1A